MNIYAHRGVCARLPENTLAAFSRAVDLGVAGIELDVHLSRDGIPVVIHDHTTDRTTNGTGRIHEFTAHELGLLDAGGGQFVPTLEQVLRLAAGRLRVNIELKDAAAAGPVVEVAAKVDGLDWFVSSADWAALAEVLRKASGAKIYPLCVGRPEKLQALLPPGTQVDQFAGRGLEAAIGFALRHGAEGISIWEGGFDAADLATIHNARLQAWVWTVNDGQRAQELRADGVDGICTDDPELIQGLITAGVAARPTPQGQPVMAGS